MPPDLTAALRTHFGFDAFRPRQEEAIRSVLAGRHTLAVMPTGGGKSLIYQLAALHRPGVTLVISPLIALMKDQVDRLKARGIPSTFIDSALSNDEQAQHLDAVATGAYRLVYVSPERLRQLSFQQALRGVTIGLLAVDEAHCVSQWGHEFRPDYRQIATARAWMGEPVTLALTATATPRVQDDIVQLLGLAPVQRVVAGVDRPNLSFEVRGTPDVSAKLHAVWELLADLTEGAAIVYVGTRREAELVSEFVNRSVSPEVPLARAYHAGLNRTQRDRIQDAFREGTLRVIVATVAFGMGIDRRDVRRVVHFGLPASLEAYYQEAGRAGRDGAPAQAVLLYDPQDRGLQVNLIAGDSPTRDDVQALYGALQARADGEIWATMGELSRESGLRTTKGGLALADLESAGAVERLGDRGQRMGLRLCRWDESSIERTLAAVDMHRRCRGERLTQMIAYAETAGCRRRVLLEHFGDPSGDGGPGELLPAWLCCDNCLLGDTAGRLAAGVDAAALSPESRTARLLLDTILRLEPGCDLKRLVRHLREEWGGERDRGQVPLCRLRGYSRREIAGLVQQMVDQEYLTAGAGRQPRLAPAPRGQAALTERSAIPLRLPLRMQCQSTGTVDQTAALFARGQSPEEIAAQRGLTKDAVYGHLARLIGEGALPLAAVVPERVAVRVRASLTHAGGAASLSRLAAYLPRTISLGQIRCVLEASRRESPVGELGQDAPLVYPVDLAPPLTFWQRMRAWLSSLRWAANPFDSPHHEIAISGDRQSVGESVVQGWANADDVRGDVVRRFLEEPHPQRLEGPWQMGWALDFNSGFAGFTRRYSPTGALVHRLKYNRDRSALAPLIEQAAAFCALHPEMVAADAVVPIPPSEPRPLDPVRSLAEGMAVRLNLPVMPALAKTRLTEPQKAIAVLSAKRANVSGAFAVKGDVKGRRLLLLDDLYDSGATLREAARVLQQAGATRVCVLTLTRTIHTDD